MVTGFHSFGFFFRTIIVTSLKFLGYSPVSYILFSCVISVRPSSSSSWVHPQVHHYLL
jgi:hypothetical protein